MAAAVGDFAPEPTCAAHRRRIHGLCDFGQVFFEQVADARSIPAALVATCLRAGMQAPVQPVAKQAWSEHVDLDRKNVAGRDLAERLEGEGTKVVDLVKAVCFLL